MEKVYLGDWLYNAGILGFLKLNNHLWELKSDKLISKDENLLKFGDNYLEFDRKIFDGFAKRFFNYAFNQYGRYESVVNRLIEYLKDLKSLDDESNFEELKNKYFKSKEKEKIKDFEILKEKLPLEILDRFKNILQGFKLLKDKLEKIPSKKEVKKDRNLLINILEKALDILEKDKDEFWESDVQIYLRKIYGQKSFLNKSINKDRFDKFFKDFEEPLLKNSNSKEKIPCLFCGDRLAKKGVIFDTGISKFYGLNPDAINLVYGFKAKLPMCEICEIIYFSYFAGLIPFKKDGKDIFYFVNSDGSLVDLVKENNLLEKKLRQNIKENALLDFFTELILQAEEEKAKYKLQNIAVLELDLNNETMPKVHSFNLSREKAEFLRKQHIKDYLKGLSKSYYRIKDNKTSILHELIILIINNKLGFDYLNKLAKYYIAYQNGSYHYETKISPYHLQTINIIISEYLSTLGGKNMETTQKETWFIYKQGIELARLLKEKNAENKIPSISYKLLNALRVGDTQKFMDRIF